MRFFGKMVLIFLVKAMSNEILASTKSEVEKAFDFLKKEFSGIQIGRASAVLVESIMVESYGQKMPLKHVANISIPGAQEIMIDPWDKSQLSKIEKALRDDPNFHFNPVNNGVGIRINIPPLTEERRREMTKIVGQKAETAKVSIRQARHAALDAIKKGDFSEDEQERLEKEIQKNVDDANKKVEEMVSHKETEIMKV